MGGDEKEEEFTGPLSDRSCTDVVFLLLFAAFIAGMGVLSYHAYEEGNISLLIRGYDSYGNICGHENEPIEGVPNSGLNMTDKGNLLYLNPNDLATDEFVKTVCVAECPDRTYTSREDIPVQFCLPGARQGDSKLCPDVPLYESCMCGSGLSLLILVLMRFVAALFVYFVYFLVIFGTIAATTVLWIKYLDEKEKLDNTPEELRTGDVEDNVKAFLIYSIVSSVFTVILLLVMLFMWSRVKLVVALFKEAGAVVMSMPFIIVQPFFTIVTVGGFLTYWGVTTLYIASCKSPETKDTSDGTFVFYETNSEMKKAFWYHLFGLFWITQFLVACQLMIIAGAVASWYFTRDKTKLGWFPVLASFYRTVRYHLGTLAFGSLIIAIIQFVKAVLSYVEQQLNKSDNAIAKFVFKCMFCCLWCLENIIRFINRNAYIMTAIYGYHFCKAAKRGFTLLVSNAVRVVAINTVGDFCLFLAKLMVVFAVVLIGIKITESNEEIEQDAIPIALGAIGTYIVAHVFLSVYEMIVDTLFLCFCEDSERNDGSPGKEYYMSENLKEFVDTTNEALLRQKEKKEEKRKLVESSEEK
ncbi:choline transporter-like protein 1 [Symsagittifera roscoffensis]|uniref:choline transporter-like protein 1 n=1 Tax=Symsagittifera roscoffensis TaxID=84072 RepID=UPI00307CB993